MRQTTITAIIIFFTLLTSCEKDTTLTACIELNSSTVNVGDTLIFTSCSKNEWSYHWFMVGPAGASENLTRWSDRVFKNSFQTPGTYEVTLSTYSDFSLLGDSASTTASFTVN